MSRQFIKISIANKHLLIFNLIVNYRNGCPMSPLNSH